MEETSLLQHVELANRNVVTPHFALSRAAGRLPRTRSFRKPRSAAAAIRAGSTATLTERSRATCRRRPPRRSSRRRRRADPGSPGEARFAEPIGRMQPGAVARRGRCKRLKELPRRGLAAGSRRQAGVRRLHPGSHETRRASIRQRWCCASSDQFPLMLPRTDIPRASARHESRWKAVAP